VATLVASLFPAVGALSLADKKTTLPSAYHFDIAGAPEHLKWAQAELQLRVGMGHELIDKLCRAVGLHSWLMGGKKKARGVESMVKVSGTLKANVRRRGDIISDYIRNWAHIARLKESSKLPSSEYNGLLQGLQNLDSKTDIKFFQEWGNRTSNYVPNGSDKVSWIWHVGMVGDIRPASNGVNQSEIERLTWTWESKGEFYYILAYCNPTVYHTYPKQCPTSPTSVPS
jgi:hypothetical protein